MKNLKAKVVACLIALPCLIGLGTYARTAYSEDQAWKAVRQQTIAASPKVYLTKTGKKYHRAYHYSGRNYETTLYEATEQHYDACMVCRPPGHEELLPPLVWYYNYWIVLLIAGVIGGWFVAGLAYEKLADSSISD